MNKKIRRSSYECGRTQIRSESKDINIHFSMYLYARFRRYEEGNARRETPGDVFRIDAPAPTAPVGAESQLVGVNHGDGIAMPMRLP